MNDEERDALLMKLYAGQKVQDERLCNLIKHFTNHIKHHWAISIPLALVAIGLIIKLFVK